MKKFSAFLCLLLLMLAMSGCEKKPGEAGATATPAPVLTISAYPDADAADESSVTLYFRYQDTALLQQEMRTLEIMPNETRELALVNALLAGSFEGGEALFPPQTQALSTQVQDGVVFVTFNEALYSRYEDENSQTDPAESRLRRELAMDALVATLTESGAYHAVQVLVRAEVQVGTSMRLKNSYFLEENELPCDVLTRCEEHLMTPANVAHSLLRAWQQRSFDTLYPLLSSQEDTKLLPAQSLFSEAFAQSPVLIAYTLTPGSIAVDGSSAVVCIDMTLRRADGSEYTLTGWPLRIKHEMGAWKVSLSSLQALMQL